MFCKNNNHQCPDPLQWRRHIYCMGLIGLELEGKRHHAKWSEDRKHGHSPVCTTTRACHLSSVFGRSMHLPTGAGPQGDTAPAALLLMKGEVHTLHLPFWKEWCGGKSKDISVGAIAAANARGGVDPLSCRLFFFEIGWGVSILLPPFHIRWFLNACI